LWELIKSISVAKVFLLQLYNTSDGSHEREVIRTVAGSLFGEFIYLKFLFHNISFKGLGVASDEKSEYFVTICKSKGVTALLVISACNGTVIARHNYTDIVKRCVIGIIMI
jgi:hypothetical protein